MIISLIFLRWVAILSEAKENFVCCSVMYELLLSLNKAKSSWNLRTYFFVFPSCFFLAPQAVLIHIDLLSSCLYKNKAAFLLFQAFIIIQSRNSFLVPPLPSLQKHFMLFLKNIKANYKEIKYHSQSHHH